jgi:hypothetical protein
MAIREYLRAAKARSYPAAYALFSADYRNGHPFLEFSKTMDRSDTSRNNDIASPYRIDVASKSSDTSVKIGAGLDCFIYHDGKPIGGLAFAVRRKASDPAQLEITELQIVPIRPLIQK